MNRKGHLTKHQKTRHRDEVQSRYGTNTRQITCKYTWYRYRYHTDTDTRYRYRYRYDLGSIGIGIGIGMNHKSSIGINLCLVSVSVSVSVSVKWYRWNTKIKVFKSIIKSLYIFILTFVHMFYLWWACRARITS